MAVSREQMGDIIVPALAAVGYELVGHELIPQGDSCLVRVYIDKPGGVNLDDCEKASRQISAVLDVEDPISNPYTLEVSSPGLNRPLFNAAHYKEAVGEVVKLKLNASVDGQRNFKGKLTSMKDGQITLATDAGDVVISIDDVMKANIVANLG